MSWKFTLYTFVLFTLSAWQLSGQSCGEFFYDSGGPDGQHQNNEIQSWTFCPDNPGDLVTLNFTFVDVEACCDDLSVYDGTGTGNPLNLDVEAPESFTSSATDGCLTVTWDSDGSVVNDGWEALISCNPPPPCPNPTLLTVSDVLGTGATFSWAQVGNVNTWDLEILPAGTLSTGVPTIADVTDNPFMWDGAETGTSYDVYVRGHCEDEGEFTNWVGPLSFTTASGCGDSFFDSGGPDGTYQNNEIETYTFCPDNAGDLVTLNFIFIDVETCCDNLTVYSGSGTGGPVLNADLIAPESFTSVSLDGCITVTWSSDGSVIRAGWEAIVSCDPPPPCPNPFFLEVISATTNGAVLGWSQEGSVTVWDLEIIPAGTMPTGVATVTDVTDNPYTWTGGESGTEYDFYVRGHCEDEGEFSYWVGPVFFRTIPGCGDSFFDSGGPNGDYQNNEFETYTFCPDNPGEAIILDFSFVSVESCCDDLSVFNGNGTANPIDLDIETPGLFISTDPSGCLTVTFDSDGSVIRPGWEASITCSPCIPDPIILTPDVSVEFFDASSVDILVNLAGLDTFMIEYDTVGFELGTGTTLMTDDSLISINNLPEGTDFEFYVVNLCPDGQATVVLGPFSFSTIYFNDVGITNVIAPTDECGLGSGEPIRVEITNFGQYPQTLFPLNYSINGVLSGVNQPVDGFFTGIVSRDSMESFEFDLNYDFDLPGEYTIQVWTEMMNDGDVENDTFTIVVTRFAPPLFEDFEAGAVPEYITTNGTIYAPLAHDNETFVLGANLFFAGGELIVDLPVLGPIQETDTLFFDYRYVEWFAGTEPTMDLTGTDLLSVLISTDCGETFGIAFLQSGTDHEPSADFRTVSVPLADFAGENVQIRIAGTYGSGGPDYWLDFDNINLPRCDGLGITAEITDATPGLDDGAATAIPASGIAPFEYLWSTGDMTETITDLAPGDYTVTITDRFGCSDELVVTVDVMVGTEEVIDLIGNMSLAPNPTQGQSNVRVDFNQSVDARIDVINLMGQQIWQSPILERVNTVNETVDLSQVPAGIYLVRIQAAGQVKTIKLVKS
ncbi:T9SS type A sorting domain-containing protein [Lewinella cohaerens]|uniref:T9SS type A sorting domain-containing protein n=1 Tax=Lewinella cohaerens TaxID=70995 RepID=UPI000379FF9E|nr:T9SS type A sorting domain-containing protein [Lewinella cohaerens]